MTVYEVAIVSHDTEQTVKTLSANSQREAEKLERGMNINLDHRFYYTEVRDPSNEGASKKSAEPLAALSPQNRTTEGTGR